VQHRSTARWCVGHDTNHHQPADQQRTHILTTKPQRTHLRHIDCNQPPLLIIEQERSESFAKLRLPHLHQHRASEGDDRKGRHTLPTPVGPKNKNDATGRLGACSPAREIRTASLIADTTWSCPTTLAARDSSIYTKPSVKPRSINEENTAHEPTYPSPPSTNSAPESP
jgi:hypothetical protein